MGDGLKRLFGCGKPATLGRLKTCPTKNALELTHDRKTGSAGILPNRLYLLFVIRV